MIFPIPGIAGNDAASRRHQIRFFHPAVCRTSPGISGAGIFVSRGLPSIMTSDRYDVRLQTHRRDRIRGRSVVSGSHCDEQPCIPCFCNPRKQLLLERSFPDRADPDGNIQNSRMINPACVQHIPDAFYHGGNVSVPTFVQHLAYYQTAAWRNSGIQTVGAFSVSAQAACHMGSMPAVVIRLLLSADKVCKPCDSPGKIRMQRDPGVQHRCRHTFSGKPVYLCRGRVDNSLYPVQGIRILFLLGYGKMGEEVCCILWKTAKKPACSPGSSTPANDRKSVSKIFLPRKKPGQACGHILNHNYPFGGS